MFGHTFVAFVASFVAVQAIPFGPTDLLGGGGGNLLSETKLLSSLTGATGGAASGGNLLGALRKKSEIQGRTYGTAINSDSTTTRDACNVGSPQCCQQIHPSTSDNQQLLSSILGLNMPVGDDLFFGLQCSSIGAAAGLGGSNQCNAQPVCCTGNQYSGLINIGCSPISLT